MRVEHIRGPAFLASALINGDTSGLGGSDDFNWLKRALDFVASGHFSDCGESDFHDGWCFGSRFIGDVVTYTVLYFED